MGFIKRLIIPQYAGREAQALRGLLALVDQGQVISGMLFTRSQVEEAFSGCVGFGVSGLAGSAMDCVDGFTSGRHSNG